MLKNTCPLFKDDVDKYYYIDTETKNVSFLRMSVMLKKMGIKNNKFMLAIRDPDLIGVDPHRNDLPKEMVAKITREIILNPWYYFREIVRIVEGPTSVPYILNRGNLALNWLFFNSIDIFETIGRQIGKTVGTQALAAYIIYFKGRNYKYGYFSKDTAVIASTIGKFKDIKNAFPKYLISPSSKDVDNKTGITYDQLKNVYATYVTSDNKRRAAEIGRGESFGSINIDEFPFCKNIKITYEVIKPAVDKTGDDMKKNGVPSSKIFTTTAGYIDTDDGAYANDFRLGAAKFNELFYDAKNEKELREIINTNSVNNFVYVCFSYLQLGFSREWFNEKTKGLSKSAVEKDYLNIWGRGSSNSVLDTATVNDLYKAVTEPNYVEKHDSYLINWYFNENVHDLNDAYSKTLFIGMDSSENIGEDFTSFVITDPFDLAPIGVLRCNETNLNVISTFIGNMLVKNRKFVWIPERNYTASTMIDIVISILQNNGINPFRRIYNDVVQKKNSEYRDVDIDDLEPVGKVRKTFGFRTRSASRSLLYNNVMYKALEISKNYIRDDNLSTEFRELSRKNGRIDHQSGKHDDTAISYLLTCYLVFYGENLSLYGVESRNLLSNVNSEEKRDQKTNAIKLARYKKLMMAKTKFGSNPQLSKMIDSELSVLARELHLKDPEESKLIRDKKKQRWF